MKQQPVSVAPMGFGAPSPGGSEGQAPFWGWRARVSPCCSELLTPCILNPPSTTALCCPVILQRTGVAPMGACDIGRTGVLMRGTWEVLLRTSLWVRDARGRAHPRLLPRFGDLCSTPSHDGGHRQPQISSPVVMPGGQDGARFWPSRVVRGGCLDGHHASGAGGAPRFTPRVTAPQLVSQWVLSPWDWQQVEQGCAVLVLLHCAPRAARDQGGLRRGREGPGSCCSPDPLPGSVPLSSPRADINSSVFPFPKFPR